MATVKNKNQRDFRLINGESNNSNPSLDFNKIKIGKSLLSGDVTAIIREHDRKNKRARHKINREFVENAIESHDLVKLRQISNHFYETSGIYSRLCRYMAYLYKYD